MKKTSLLMVLGLSLLTLTACGGGDGGQGSSSTSSQQQATKYTVKFYSEDTLYKTLKVEENTTIGSENVDDPIKSGYLFVNWVDIDNNVVDLDTYTVTKNINLYATFEEVITDDTLIVNAEKEPGVDYYLVVGWWETTKTNDDGSPKITSSLDVSTVRLFYDNLNKYLKAYGASDAQMDLVQFRDYSTAEVAEMGQKINTDGDVDLMIGVGNNINSDAGVSLYEGNDGKIDCNMGTQLKSRKVALVNHEEMNPLAISIFDWLKTDLGKEAFKRELQDSEITVAPERTNNVDLKVTVNGATDPVVTQMTTKDDAIQVPTLTIEEGYKFLGYATTENATEAEITAAVNTPLTYKDVEKLVGTATTLTLYPVIVEEIINNEFDLVVYVHVVSSAKINQAEIDLVADRFAGSLDGSYNIKYVYVTEGNAEAFKERIQTDIAAGETIDVVIGGNATTNKFNAYDVNTPNVSIAAGHFEDTSRKVIVLNSCASNHVDLAKQLYAFLTTEAPEYELSIAYWLHLTKSWVTADEIEAINAGVQSYVNTYLDATDAFTTYNLSLEYFEVSVEGNKVADLSVATKALNDGAGVGLIVGSGGNATDDGNMGSAILEHKKAPLSLVAGDRYVSLCNADSIYTAIFNNYFAEAVAEA